MRRIMALAATQKRCEARAQGGEEGGEVSERRAEVGAAAELGAAASTLRPLRPGAYEPEAYARPVPRPHDEGEIEPAMQGAARSRALRPSPTRKAGPGHGRSPSPAAASGQAAVPAVTMTPTTATVTSTATSARREGQSRGRALKAELFHGKDCLDIGCNAGQLTARRTAVRQPLDAGRRHR